MSDNTSTQNLPTTPDWSKAPDWAKYFSINANGTGYFSDLPPFLTDMMLEGWLIKKPGRTSFAGNFNSTSWRYSLQQRPKIEGLKPDGVWIDEAEALSKPKIETLIFRFNTDISGYLVGKNSFITGLVDLLLARMAKEERFGLVSNSLSIAKQFDIYKVKQKTTVNDWGIRYFIVFNTANLDDDYRITGIEITEKGEQFWGHLWDMDLKSRVVAYCRLITEIEAVEFRTAMEAVYG